MPNPPFLSWLLIAVEVSATLAFALSGLLAICAFAGGWVLVLALHAGLAEGPGLLLAAATASGLRLLALVTGYTLPRWSSESDVA